MFKLLHSPLLIIVFCVGCSSLPERRPLPEEFVEEAQIPGIQDARYWADDSETATKSFFPDSGLDPKEYPALYGVEHNYLAISGGGPRGAFAAGFLNGWTKAGTRPDFVFVTGVSTGALIAPFAFLGSDYDHILEDVYTNISTDDVLTKRSLYKIITLDGAADNTPLRGLIEKYFDMEVMLAIADKYVTGPTLIIVTTNLDAARPVAWNIGAIANSGDPNALKLLQDILVASAAIPGVFPPVMIQVEARSGLYDEMHVDGGVTSQLHLYPLEFDATTTHEKFNVLGAPKAYVIRNGYVEAHYKAVQRSTLAIAAASMATLMGNISYGDMYRIYIETQRDGVEFELAYVPESFNEPLNEPFDQQYMRKLYEVGYELAIDGYDWKDSPPDYETE